jgi:signal transduction histidine kinase
MLRLAGDTDSFLITDDAGESTLNTVAAQAEAGAQKRCCVDRPRASANIRFKLLSLHVGQFKDRVAHGYEKLRGRHSAVPGGTFDASSGAPERRSPAANQVRGTPTVPSRSKKSRNAGPGSARSSGVGAPVAFGQPRGRPVTDVLDPATRDQAAPIGPAADSSPAGSPGARPVATRSRRRILRNWRVRSRLVLLIAIPTATAVALGGISIVSSWRSAVNYQRVARLANLTAKITRLAYELEYERDNTVWFIALRTRANGTSITNLSDAARSQLQVVHKQYKYTDKWIGPVRSGVAAIESGYPEGVVVDARSVEKEIGFIPSARAALTPATSPISVINDYDLVINVLLAFEDQIALSSNDPQLTSTVSALGQISRYEHEYSNQRALIVYAVTLGKFAPNMFDKLNASVANQQSDLTQFDNFASAQQSALFNVRQAAGLRDRVKSAELTVIQYGPTKTSQANIVPEEWFGNITETIGNVRSVEQALVSQAVNRAQDLRKRAIIAAIAIGGAVLLVLVISLLFTVVVGRSMVRPLRRLRAGALEVAGLRLPETVRRMSEADSENISIDVDPIDVDSFDEIGEVARAFDQVHREALRLAANEAALRGNVNAMFVNLSRRSQSLVERQIRLIDELEQGEQDPERLGSLFQMDHLATRMRRNSENLLVLAGHESTRRWNQPVPLVDVLRAAVSEIEQYERVTLNVQPGIAVRGPAVNDVVHLIAELAENATSFSSADTPVNVSGHLLSSGGVLLDITDLGVGMGSEEMAHANWRLDNPPVVDVAVSRRMGLFVVARLAARHGIRVRLRPATGAGLTALVWLPDEVVVREGVVRPGGGGRFPEPLARFAIGPGPAGTASPDAAGSGELAGAPGSGPVGSGEWSAVAASTAEQEVAAARTPRFAPPEQEAGPPLAPQRVPGVGPYPGRFGGAATGPIPVVEPDSAAAEPAAYADEHGQPEAGAVDAQPAASGGTYGTGPSPVFGAEHPSVPSSAAGNEWPAPAAAAVAEQEGQPAAWGSDRPSQPAVAWPGDQSERTVLGASVPGPSGSGSASSFRSEDSAYGTSNGGVIVPPAASLGEENRLPIFEAVESDWFRRGRPSVDVSGGQAESSRSWTSPADEGWKVAEAAVAPSSGGTTVAGLPRRVPRANLIPGTAADTTTPAPVRSAAATRERFASLQRGVREARAASATEKSDGTGDVPGDG